jgi:transcriptional regulator GlxA family with amidase domain
LRGLKRFPDAVRHTATVMLQSAMAMRQDQTKHIGILLFPDVEELDAVGPWEVLAFWTRYFPADGYEVGCLSCDGAPVRGAKGLGIEAHYSFVDAPPLEVLIHPGGQGTRPQLTDAEHLDWVRRQREVVPIMASVCTGALVYAAAGLLSGRPATTHWASLDHLGELDPHIEVRRDARFVDDGDVITSAGVSAGIDMALHLVARLADPERAQGVRRGIEYAPAPLSEGAS